MSEAGAWTELRVSDVEAGMRLDVFLARRFSCSRSRVLRLEGQIFDGRGTPLVRFSRRLQRGECVRVRGRRHPEPDIKVEYRLLFQDEHLVAVDKGPGCPVHPSHGIRRHTLLGRLREDLGDEQLLPAHRLDRETSGPVVFGRGRNVTAKLMRFFATGAVEKFYLALVGGEPSFEKLSVELPLGRDRNFPINCRMRVDTACGKPAITVFSVLARGEGCALVGARPLTGRQHQIRVHLASLGHPLLGDKLYQYDGRFFLAMLRDQLDQQAFRMLGHTRQALCCLRLGLRHPVSGERLVLEAPPAEDFYSLAESRGIRLTENISDLVGCFFPSE